MVWKSTKIISNDSNKGIVFERWVLASSCYFLWNCFQQCWALTASRFYFLQNCFQQRWALTASSCFQWNCFQQRGALPHLALISYRIVFNNIGHWRHLAVLSNGLLCFSASRWKWIFLHFLFCHWIEMRWNHWCKYIMNK